MESLTGFYKFERQQLLHYFLVAAFLFCTVAAQEGFAAIKTKNASSVSNKVTVNLVIDDFELFGVSERLSFIKRGFSEIIQLSMLPYQNVNVVPRGRLWETLRKMPEIPREEWNTSRIFKDDVLHHPDVSATHLLSGEIYNIGRALQLNAYLIDLSSREEIALEPIFFPEETIFDNTKKFAALLDEKLRKFIRNTDSVSQLTEVFICISKPEQSRDDLEALVATDLSIFLEEKLQQEFGIAADVDENNINCVAKAKESTTWKSENTAVIINATVKVTSLNEKKMIEFEPTMEINNPALSIAMVEVFGSKDDYGIIREGFMKVATDYVGKTLRKESISQLVELSSKDNKTKSKVNVEADVKQGVSLYESGEHMVSAKYFRRAIKYNPRHAVANYYMARLFADNGFTLKAIEYYEKAIRSKPDYVEALEKLAESYEQVQNYHIAKLQYEKILELDPNNINASRSLGNIYLGVENRTKANYYLRLALSNEENDVESMLSLASLAIRNKEYGDAVKWYKKVIELDPNNQRAKSSIASIYRRLAMQSKEGNDLTAAINYLSKEIEITGNNMSPESIDARLNRAHLYLDLAQNGDTNADENYLVKAINDLSSLSSAYNKRTSNQNLQFVDIDLVLAHLMKGNYTKAGKLSLKSISNHYDNLELRIFARLLNIAARTMAEGDPSAQEKVLEEDLSVLKGKASRRISGSLNERYNMITELTIKNNSLSDKKRQYVQRLTKKATSF